jgi:hypothetical protein
MTKAKLRLLAWVGICRWPPRHCRGSTRDVLWTHCVLTERGYVLKPEGEVVLKGHRLWEAYQALKRAGAAFRNNVRPGRDISFRLNETDFALIDCRYSEPLVVRDKPYGKVKLTDIMEAAAKHKCQEN